MQAERAAAARFSQFFRRFSIDYRFYCAPSVCTLTDGSASSSQLQDDTKSVFSTKARISGGNG
jgi:hypothetical protein